MNWSPMSTNAIAFPIRPRQLEVEDPAVPLERLVDVTDLERDVVDPDEPWHVRTR